jgi:hypothetical protein
MIELFAGEVEEQANSEIEPQVEVDQCDFASTVERASTETRLQELERCLVVEMHTGLRVQVQQALELD